MDAKISEKELDIFLEEAQISSQTEQNLQKEKGESLEKLLEDIMGSAKEESPPPSEEIQEKNYRLFNQIDKPKRKTFSLWPLLLSIAFFGGCFLGTIFGFSWGHSKKNATSSPAFVEMDAKITQLVREIEEIYEKITPMPPADEMIEPVTFPDDLSRLSPKATS